MTASTFWVGRPTRGSRNRRSQKETRNLVMRAGVGPSGRGWVGWGRRASSDKDVSRDLPWVARTFQNAFPSSPWRSSCAVSRLTRPSPILHPRISIPLATGESRGTVCTPNATVRHPPWSMLSVALVLRLAYTRERKLSRCARTRVRVFVRICTWLHRGGGRASIYIRTYTSLVRVRRYMNLIVVHALAGSVHASACIPPLSLFARALVSIKAPLSFTSLDQPVPGSKPFRPAAVI